MLRRTTVQLGTAFVCSLVTGCFVPQNRYDEVVTRLHGEEAARKADDVELARVRADLARLDQTLGSRESSLTTRERELSQAKLDSDRVSTERDDAVVLVEQLRSELARVGDNLREYSEQKRELEAALGEADLRAKRLDQAEKSVEQKVLLVRDVSLALVDAVKAGTVSVTVVDGKPAVRLDSHDVFAEKGAEVRPGSVPVLARLASTLATRTSARVELGDRSTDSVSPEDRIVRLQRVADVFAENGVGLERIAFAVAAPGAPSPSTETPAAAGHADGEPSGGATPASRRAAAVVAVGATSALWRDGAGSVEIVIEVGAPG